MPSKLEHALSLARRGFYVFPVRENSKFPLIPWRFNSSRNENTIKSWWIDPVLGWEKNHNIGIDCGKSGLVVLDPDCKDGKQGIQTLAALCEERPLPETYTVHTPSGGLHYYFKASGFKNTVEKLGPGLDTRAFGGYVVAVGSDIDGKEYVAEDLVLGGAIPPLPETWKELLNHFRVLDEKNMAEKIISADKPDDIKWAIDYLENDADEAVQGSRNATLYKTACVIKERGVGYETGLELIVEHYTPRILPGMDMDELKTTVKSAYKTAHNATGAKTLDNEFDMEGLKLETAPPPAKLKNEKWWEGEKFGRVDAIPYRPFVFGTLALEKKVTIIVAPGGTGKSTLTLQIAISKATGRDFMGIDPLGAGNVMVINNEDDTDEMRRRGHAIFAAFNISAEEVDKRMWIFSGTQHPFRIAERGENSHKLKPRDADRLVQFIRDNDIKMVIIDPFAETHPAKENDNEEILDIGRMYRAVADLAGCAMVLVHHTRKLPGATSDGHSGNLDSMRGASSLGGLARVVVTFDSMGAREAKRYGVPEEERSKFVLMETAKANMSAPGEHHKWFERTSVSINATIDNPDGERIGVLKPVNLALQRDKVDSATADFLRDIQELVDGKDEPMVVSEIADELCAAFVSHHGKKAETLARSIRRLFDDSEELETRDGVLHLEGTRGAKTIRFERLRTTPAAPSRRLKL